jgi:hypothetical protein
LSADTGFVMGKTIPTGKLLTFGAPRDHLAGAISALPLDRRALAAARRLILGQWWDGAARATFQRSSRFVLSGPDGSHPFKALAPCPAPNSWTFASWHLHLTNVKHQCGVRVPVLRLDSEELHVAIGGWVAGHRDRLAHVFRRRAGRRSPRAGAALPNKRMRLTRSAFADGSRGPRS